MVPTGLPVVILVRRLVAIPILSIVESGATVRVRVIVVIVIVHVDAGVEVCALSELRQRKGAARGQIGLSVDFRGSTEVKDESGDGGAD